MIVIKKKCFKNNWITNKYQEMNIDPILVEKAIYAFELLGDLIENGVDFIFKGGTGLMLLISGFKRLSIDIETSDTEINPAYLSLLSIFFVLLRDFNADRRYKSGSLPDKEIFSSPLPFAIFSLLSAGIKYE